jgi:anti-anti-sigma regulatory factor
MKKQTKTKTRRGATTKVAKGTAKAGASQRSVAADVSDVAPLGEAVIANHDAAEPGAEVDVNTEQTLEEVATHGVVSLPNECTTADASELKDRLMKLVSHPDTVTLDRANVQRVDTATLQMLAAFVRDRRAEGLAVEWSGEGAAFKNAAGLLGLSSLL